jgi:hypothetical protein
MCDQGHNASSSKSAHLTAPTLVIIFCRFSGRERAGISGCEKELVPIKICWEIGLLNWFERRGII